MSAAKPKRKALQVINEELDPVHNNMDAVTPVKTAKKVVAARAASRRKLSAIIDEIHERGASSSDESIDGGGGSGDDETGAVNENNDDADYDPTGASESLAQYEKRRKRISRTFNELTAIGDRDMNQTSSSNASPAVAANANASQIINTQTVPKKERSRKSNKAGVVQEIFLKNFKCHGLLEFKLHKYINFILGRNGSGKSAVMDGVILCLGGRASCTGRQASAKTFIKTNSDKAELRVTLANEGVEAYKQDQYGSKIIIERRLSKDGQSGYKIMSEDGRVVSTKKSELDNIIEQFNIQVDNPVCFLNQETSKHFLASANKAEKYKLFLKASQLDTVRHMLEMIDAERSITERIIEDKAKYLPVLEKEVKMWEQKYKKCQSVEKLRQKCSALIKEMAWAHVVAREKIIEACDKDKRAIDKSKEKHIKKIDEHNEHLKTANENKETLTSKINTYHEQSRALRERELEANESLTKVQQTYRATQSDTKKYKQQLAKKEKDRNELVAKLAEDKKSSRDDYEEEKRQKEEKLAETARRIDECQSRLGERGHETKRYEQEIEAKKKAIRDKDFDVKNIERLVKNCEEDINKLQNTKKDQIFKFGDFMHALVNDVKK